MKFNELIKVDEIELLNENSLRDNEIKELYIGDLLSRVIAKIDENTLWLTVQAQINALAVACLSECPVIIFTEDVEVNADLVKKANENQITLFKTCLLYTSDAADD